MVSLFLRAIARNAVRIIVCCALGLAGLWVALEAWFWFGLPPILRGVESGFFLQGAGPNQMRIYEERLRAEFPVGIKEEDLVQRLEAQGYSRLMKWENGKAMEFVAGSIVCSQTWFVIWQSNEGRSGIKRKRRRLADLPLMHKRVAARTSASS